MRTFLTCCVRRAFTSLGGFPFAFGLAGAQAATRTHDRVINGFFLSTEYHGRFLP